MLFEYSIQYSAQQKNPSIPFVLILYWCMTTLPWIQSLSNLIAWLATRYAGSLVLSNRKEKTHSEWCTQLEAQAVIVLITRFTITVVIRAEKDSTEPGMPLVFRVERLQAFSANQYLKPKASHSTSALLQQGGTDCLVSISTSPLQVN